MNTSRVWELIKRLELQAAGESHIDGELAITLLEAVWDEMKKAHEKGYELGVKHGRELERTEVDL